MKRKILAILTILAVLCTTFAVQTLAISAEDANDSLRAWFDFRDESYFRDGSYFEILQLKEIEAGNEPEELIWGSRRDDLQKIEGPNGNAFVFPGTTGKYDTNEKFFFSDSSFVIQSPTNLLEGDNITINIVYAEGESSELQPLFSTGFAGYEYIVLASSWKTQNVGPSIALSMDAENSNMISSSIDDIPETLTWNMLSYVQEGNVGKIYLNGELLVESDLQYKLEDIDCAKTSEEGFYIYALGAITSFESNSLIGGIDDFRIYGSALTQEEIQVLAQELNVVESDSEEADSLDAYAVNMFGLVVKDSYDDVGGVAVPDEPGDNTDGIGNIHNNAWVKVPNVAFGKTGATNITLKYCAKESRMGSNGKVAIWKDGKSQAENGTLIGEVDLPITGTEYNQFSTITADLISKVTGTHDVYFVFTADTTESNPYVANMSYFQFGPKDASEPGHEELVSSTVIDWDFSDADSIADVTLGEGVTVENGKATFAPGNQGIALPDDIFKDAETITIEMTLQPSAFADYRALLCGGQQNGKWFVMGVMGDGSVRYALATNGDDGSETKGNSTTGSAGNAHASYQSGAVLTTDAEHTVKYVITQTETNVYIDGELALTLPTPDKDAIGEIGGPVVLGKATKWPDSSYEGTISNFKVTIEKMQWVAGGAGDSDEDNSTTGDIAMLATLLTAGIAALGGAKLRKKNK